jgi:serine/threonine-protein kinase RsbW
VKPAGTGDPETGDWETGDWETEDAVRLALPASFEYLRIVRLTASGVASRLGFDVEDIENLRVAIDELTSLVVECAAPGQLELTFATGSGTLEITGRAPVNSGAEVAVEDLTEQILKAVTDDYELGVSDGFASFRCSRRLPSV